ncbi:MAG: peptidoglycan-binding protein [Acidobacteria bacterium]|nr:peptidoglycan-binding protein [Acidobacteriota bacterium]MBI3656339.1 peptidoglycan-binding protein [Acidobacteriota bacterium]
MAQIGIARIDQLFEGQNANPISAGEPDADAVGVIQDFLIGHGHNELPHLLDSARGVFGPKTTNAVNAFQQSQTLPITGAVDGGTLQAMVAAPAIQPLASQGYLTLVLDFLFTGLTRVLSLTTQFEGGGQFAAFNLNTDGAGLSFGLIQWAQKPGRLHELLSAFQQQELVKSVQILGDGDGALVAGLLVHTSKPQGGVDPKGHTTNPQFNLTAEPWVSRFHAAAQDVALQRVQVKTALAAFQASLQRLQAFAPQIKSERGVAFMLDLANQHGDGGGQSIFQKVQQPGMTESALLAAMTNESVARVRAQFANKPNGAAIIASTKNRRDAFSSHPLLADTPFAPDGTRS